jgi:hypothetical protein
MAKVPDSLTGDDLALCEEAIGHALNWWTSKGRAKHSFGKRRVAELTDLSRKLNAIENHAYPYTNGDAQPLDLGKEILMRIDREAVRKTRSTARSRCRALAAGKL